MSGYLFGGQRVPDFLLELRTEEIPARMQEGARAALEKAFREHMAATGVTHGAITVWSTPRRLALIARGLPGATEPQREAARGGPHGDRAMGNAGRGHVLAERLLQIAPRPRLHPRGDFLGA